MNDHCLGGLSSHESSSPLTLGTRDIFSLPRLEKALLSLSAMTDPCLGGLSSHQSSSPFPESIHPLIESQNAIGWRQLLRGRASLLWGQHQQQQYEGRSPSDHTVTGVNWVTAVLSFLLLQILDIWNQRNAAIFDPSSEEAPEYRRDKVLQELRLIHSLRTQYRAGDTQFLFTNDPDDEEDTFRHYIDRDGIYRTEVWISNWSSFFKKSLKKAKLRPSAAQATPSIRNVFNRFAAGF